MRSLPHCSGTNKPCDGCEYIFDIHFEEDITHIWSRDLRGRLHHHPLFFHPIIYVAEDVADDQYPNVETHRSLEEIARDLKLHPDIISVEEVRRHLSSKHDQSSLVLKIEVFSPTRLPDLVQDLKNRRYNMYNVDLNARQQFFLDTKSYPLGACHILTWEIDAGDYLLPDGSQELVEIQMYDDYSAIMYKVPSLIMMEIVVNIDHVGTFPKFSDPLESLTLNLSYHHGDIFETIRTAGEEAEQLMQLVDYIKSYDPDVLNVLNGDRFLLNYLAHRAAEHDLTDQFILGRLPIPHYPRRTAEGQTYMTYGQIMRRDPVWYIPGRIHLDAENSFFMYESGFAGLIDLCRMGGAVPERTSRASIGAALTGIEFHINASTQPPTLVPPAKADGEQFKPAEGLLIADNGGLIYPGLPGVYDRVWAIDFTSLYPFIMAKHNIGNETVLCDHAECARPGSTLITVPEVNYHVCHKRIGVVPRTMNLVLKKRLSLKLLRKYDIDEEEKKRFKGVDSALKWILVSCFGYLGFKNARWGSIESHQCVTAWARQYLRDARAVCEDHNFEVIAGITDSLFIRARDPQDDNPQVIRRIVNDITYHSGIPIDTEGRFNWVVFCNVREYNEVAALNRYFGFFDHGEFKLRGIKHRQRRACKLEKDFQEAVLAVFAGVATTEEFRQLIPKANQVLIDWKEKLRRREIDPSDLVIKIKSHKGADGYKATSTVQALTVKKYQQQGREIKAGQSFFYLVSDDSVKTVDRIVIGPNVDTDTYYDADWYCKMLEDDFLELLEAPQIMFFNEIIYDGNQLGTLRKLGTYFEEEETAETVAIHSNKISLESYF